MLLDLGLGLLRLIGPDEVLGQCLIDDVQAGLDGGGVVGCAVLAEQELEHVDGHVGADFDLADEVLAYDPPGEHRLARSSSRSAVGSVKVIVHKHVSGNIDVERAQADPVAASRTSSVAVDPARGWP